MKSRLREVKTQAGEVAWWALLKWRRSVRSDASLIPRRDRLVQTRGELWTAAAYAIAMCAHGSSLDVTRRSQVGPTVKARGEPQKHRGELVMLSYEEP